MKLLSIQPIFSTHVNKILVFNSFLSKRKSRGTLCLMRSEATIPLNVKCSSLFSQWRTQSFWLMTFSCYSAVQPQHCMLRAASGLLLQLKHGNKWEKKKIKICLLQPSQTAASPLSGMMKWELLTTTISPHPRIATLNASLCRCENHWGLLGMVGICCQVCDSQLPETFFICKLKRNKLWTGNNNRSLKLCQM